MDSKYFHCEKLYEDSDENLWRGIVLPDGSLFTIGCVRKSLHPFKKQPVSQFLFGRRSTDGGRSFSETTFFYQFEDRENYICPGDLMIDRDGRLHVFCLRIWKYDVQNMDGAKGHYSDHFQGDTLYVRFDNIRGENPFFQKLTCLDRYCGSVNNCIQLRSGRIVIPFSTVYETEHSVFQSQTIWSDDGGETWQASNDIKVESEESHGESGAVEPVIVETDRDGHLIMLIRTVLGWLYYAVSEDGGESWSEAMPTAIPSSNAPAELQKLPDGRMLVLWNDCAGMPMSGVRYSGARQSLVAAVSRDNLKTLQGVRTFIRKSQEDTVHIQSCYPTVSFYENGDMLVKESGSHWRCIFSRVPVEWLEERSFRWDFADGFGPWVLEKPAVSGSWVTLAKNWERPGFGCVNFPYGTSGSLRLQVKGAGEAKFLLSHAYLDVTSFEPSVPEKYRPFLENEYAAVVLPVTEGELTVTWKDGEAVLKLGAETRTVRLPDHIKGLNHLTVLTDGAVSVGSLEVQTDGDLATGIVDGACL